MHLSVTFDTIDHVILFDIKYIYIYISSNGNALQSIISYFSHISQRVQIDGILSEFASIVCGGFPRVSFRSLEVLHVYIAPECYFDFIKSVTTCMLTTLKSLSHLNVMIQSKSR